jgi:exodeoxyribonuclease-3
MDDFREHVDHLLKDHKKLCICGDYNICHQPMDIHDPVRLKTVSGFLPEEREWLTSFLELGLTDSFRYFHPETVQYSWWSYRANARAKNKGWRLDYHLVTEDLLEHTKRSLILPEAKHSDHCPVLLET